MPSSLRAALGFWISYEEFSMNLKSRLIHSITRMNADKIEEENTLFQEAREAMHSRCDEMNDFISQMEISEKNRTKLYTKVQKLQRLYDAVPLDYYIYGSDLNHLSVCTKCRENVISDIWYLDSGRDEKRIYQGYLSKFFTSKDSHPFKYVYRLEAEIQTEFDEYKKKMERKNRTTSADVITDAKVLNFPQVRTGHIHTWHTSTTVTQRTPSDKLYQIQVRVENLMNGNGKLNDGELEDISQRVQLLWENFPELHSTVQQVLASVSILLEKRDISTWDKSSSKNFMIVPSQDSDILDQKINLDYVEIDRALWMIQSFRKHVGVPSSTNHTSSWSIWDGSFWYRAISPMFDFLGQQIQKWEIDPNDFSWAQLASMHIESVEIRNQIDNLSIFRIQLRQFDKNQNLLDNVHLLSKVLISFRWTGGFRDENCFMTLINLIDTF